MSVTLRPYRSGAWEVDITIRLPDGSQYRERKRASRFSKSAAHRWAQERERYLLQHGPPAAAGRRPHSKHSRRDSSTGTHGRTVTSRAAFTRSNPSSDGISFLRSGRRVSTRSPKNRCSG
jgi:hypothetical protein